MCVPWPCAFEGNGPFEVIDLEEMEAVLQSNQFYSEGQNNFTWIVCVKMPS